MTIFTGAEAHSLPLDLTACEREPIHLAGAIEPNGTMLVLGEQALTVLQASSNSLSQLNATPESLLGMHLADLFSPEDVIRLVSGSGNSGKHHYVRGVQREKGVFIDALVHRHQGLLVIELEPSSPPTSALAQPDIYTSLTDALAELSGRLPLADLCERIGERIRGLTGFDRVMVYRFLPDDTGTVIAESRRQDIVPYLGLRYPASDIPPQARRLYLLNTLRLKPDVNAPSARLIPAMNPFTGQALDMTYCVLRAMSPVHVEYLRNMGVAASMSISIVKDERLWGLIACHHAEAKVVSHPTRIICEVLARVFASRIAMAEEEDNRAHATALHALTSRIEERMRRGRDVVAALSQAGDDIAAIIAARGCASFIRGEIVLFGTTPNSGQVLALSAWLRLNQREHIFATEQLATDYPDAGTFAPETSGLLSLRIALGGPDFVLWFRPPVVQEINWAGNPDKPVEEPDAGQRLSPRRSFAIWKQTFLHRSAPWTVTDLSFAASLRPVIAETLFLLINEEVLRLNLELSRSNAELSSFAGTASHDLQEPLRTMRIYAQLVAQRAAPDMDAQSRSFIGAIEEAAERMAGLIGALLSYSQLGGVERRRSRTLDLAVILRGVMANLDIQIRPSGAIVTHDALPNVLNDEGHVVQLLQNLISNAIKYRGEEPPRIHITSELQSEFCLFSVQDNGQGFDPAHAETIFEPFKRLHGRNVPGHGIGLATCKRIVELYGGRIWAESDGKDKGAKFCFTLPAGNIVTAQSAS